LELRGIGGIIGAAGGRGSGVNKHEHQYRRSQRLIIYLFLGWLPFIGAVMYFNAKWFPSTSWPFFITAGVYLALLVAISVQTIAAYYRWKN
jgi:hypothetical protein